MIRLSVEGRRQLQLMVGKGNGSKKTRRRVRALLKADESGLGPVWTDKRTAEFAEVSLSTVHRVRQQFIGEGVDAALFGRPATDRQYRKADCDRL